MTQSNNNKTGVAKLLTKIPEKFPVLKLVVNVENRLRSVDIPKKVIF